MTDDDHSLHRLRRHAIGDRALLRRDFLQLVAASATITSGCVPDPAEKLLPYTRQPRDVMPGEPTFYATSMLIDGFATGLIAQTRDGRPTKIEGNPVHPASLGATSKFHQAAVLQLYDPDRAASVIRDGVTVSWDALDAALRTTHRAGSQLRLVLEPTSSPLVHALIGELKTRFPDCRATFHAALPAQAPSAATEALFGRPLAPQYDLTRAQVLVAFDSDLLACPFELRYAREFAAKRAAEHGADGMNRLYVAEAAMSVTGTMADHRLACASRRIGSVVLSLAHRLVSGITGSDSPSELSERERAFVDTLARDLLRRAPGTTLVVAGDRQPSEVHAACYALNLALGNLGQTLRFTAQAVPESASDQSLAALAAEMHAGKVDRLIVLGANPSYDAPADLLWNEALRAVPFRVYAGLYRNESARAATWFAPLAHPFESWGDGRAYDGTLSFAQPLVRPLRAAKTATELLAMVAQLPPASDHTRLRVRFGRDRGEELTVEMSAAERAAKADPRIEAQWERAVADGLIKNSAFEHVRVEGKPEAAISALRRAEALAQREGFELNLLHSPSLHDGRFSNVSWLLELPDPVLKLTWDNAALVSPATAHRLGVDATRPSGDYPMVELTRSHGKVRLPLVVMEGHADDSVSVWIGYGRSGDEQLARGVGVNVLPLRTTDAPAFGGGLALTALKGRYPLAFTQLHHDMQGRALAFRRTLQEYQAEPDFAAESKGALPTLLPAFKLSGPQWAMTIDLSKCTGCSACVVACQAENNVPVVGKDQVLRGRSMHWLRIDTYYEPNAHSGVIHQPMMCQHCENAPCEYVCPVNATEHSPDGLNEMVYNRCIGTRFCSNNCPYKVRRFNWFNWIDHVAANQGEVMLQRNPDVTVRDRGVMEKCTYCVQRIRSAEIKARNERREIGPSEVTTACQQACPTRAIEFGSLHHEEVPMVRSRSQDRSYAALHETGARPRTMYLARIDNPNPEQG